MAISINHKSFRGLTLVIDVNTQYINATALTKRYKERTGKYKQPSDWLKNSATVELIEYVAEMNGVSPESLVTTGKGGKIPDEKGTFLHPDLAIPFAAWLSVEFRYAVTKIIQREIAGDTQRKIDQIMQSLESIKALLSESHQLSQKSHTINHEQSSKIQATLQIAQDACEEILSEE